MKKHYYFILFLICFNNILLGQTITILDPNGGEELQGGTEYVISWEAEGTSGYFYVEYSYDGGSDYIGEGSLVFGNSLTWNVPNLTSNICYIMYLLLNTISNCILRIKRRRRVLIN